MVTMVSSDPCGVCGYIRKGFMFPSMRINKRSMRPMRSTGVVALAVRPGRCPECWTDSGSSPSLRWVLDPASAVEVEAYRLKRWPELAAEKASR